MTVPGANRRQILAEIEVLNGLSRGFNDFPEAKRDSLLMTIDTLGVQLAESLAEKPDSTAQGLIGLHGTPLKTLLRDEAEEPFTQGAFMANGRPYSLITLINHVYCSSCPARGGSLFDSQVPLIIEKQKHPEMQQLVQLFARSGHPLEPTANQIARCKWLGLSPPLNEDVWKLAPLALRNECKTAIDDLRQKIETQNDELSLALKTWNHGFLNSLRLLRNRREQLRTNTKDEWTVLQEHTGLLKEILVDAWDGAPLQEDAFIANTKGWPTYNRESVEKLRELQPELVFLPHPALKDFLDWLKSADEKLKPMKLHQRRLEIEKRTQEAKATEDAYAELTRVAVENVQKETNQRLDVVVQRMGWIHSELDALDANLMQNEERIASTRKSMQTCSQAALETLGEIRSIRTGVAQEEENLRGIQDKADKHNAKVKKEEQALARKIEELNERNRRIDELLEKVAGGAGENARAALELEKAINETEMMIANRNSGFLKGMLVVVGVGVGILTGTGAGMAALQAGFSASTATAIGGGTCAATSTGFAIVSKTDTAENSRKIIR